MSSTVTYTFPVTQVKIMMSLILQLSMDIQVAFHVFCTIQLMFYSYLHFLGSFSIFYITHNAMWAWQVQEFVS